jgi:hypothetical protein
MVFIVAIGLYKLIRRFPVIVLLIYATESSAQIITVDAEQQKLEEVEILSQSLVIQSERITKVIKNKITVSCIPRDDFYEHDDFTYIQTAYHRLYILYSKWLLEFDEPDSNRLPIIC